MPGQRPGQPHSDFVWTKVYACLGVTCHLHIWQNDRGLLPAAAVTRGLERTPNKRQRTKLTPEKKILPPLLPSAMTASILTSTIFAQGFTRLRGWPKTFLGLRLAVSGMSGLNDLCESFVKAAHKLVCAVFCIAYARRRLITQVRNFLQIFFLKEGVIS